MGRARVYRWLFLALGFAVVVAAVLALASLRGEPKAPKSSSRPRRRWLLAATLAVPLVASGLVGGAFAYDAARSEVIAAGVRIGPVEVGGLAAGEARRKLERVYRSLNRPIVVRSGTERFTLAPRKVGVVAHVEEAVAEALAGSRQGSFLVRAARDVAGRKTEAQLRVHVSFSSKSVSWFAHRIKGTVDRPPRAASVEPGEGGLAIRAAADGLEVDVIQLRRQLERHLAHVTAPRRLSVPVLRIRPKVTTGDLAGRYPTYITIDRSRFQLRLYKRLKLARTYTVAVGALGYDTPSGLYRIQNMAVNPVWSVPHSAWTGSLAGAVIPAGPSNPLKARWLGIDGAVGIHGTAQDWSLGSAASHGCIRMSVPDVIELYDRVGVGTPVYII